MTAVNEGTRGDKRKANQPAAVCGVCGNHAPVEAVVAAARAEGRAEALREAADEYAKRPFYRADGSYHDSTAPDWLNARADHITATQEPS